MKAYIGTAAWSLPPEMRSPKADEISVLQDYAKVFNAVEINTSFYKSHKAETYARWRDLVPEDFRFSVKLSRRITHDNRLSEVRDLLDEVLPPLLQLGAKLGALLVQIPPSLEFQKRLENEFFYELRSRFEGRVAFEPRHPSWMSPDALEVLHKFDVDLVFADPTPYPNDAEKIAEASGYFRLHGSPVIYQSTYADSSLRDFARFARNTRKSQDWWCIFDNTMFGHAVRDALRMKELLGEDPSL